ncbi:hypothetical protein scyTo_0016781, partial [Scyliorhinus torazame]|nr:hypothetical protein [Scyliorhinus torazame]
KSEAKVKKQCQQAMKRVTVQRINKDFCSDRIVEFS